MILFGKIIFVTAISVPILLAYYYLPTLAFFKVLGVLHISLLSGMCVGYGINLMTKG